MVVVVPFPIGTGNDLSRELNWGKKQNINYIYEYFHKLDSPNNQIVDVDIWRFRCFKSANDKTGSFDSVNSRISEQ